MILKSGVNVCGLRPELLLALAVADKIYDSHGVDMVVTSLNDSHHSYTSLHYAGSAADLRVHNLPDGTAQTVADQIKQALSIDYDVILEGEGTSNAHVHVEYDPKRRG